MDFISKLIRGKKNSHVEHVCIHPTEQADKRGSLSDTDAEFIHQVVEELIDRIPEKSDTAPQESSSRSSVSTDCVPDFEPEDLNKKHQDTDTDVTEYESAADTDRSGKLSSSASLLTFSDQLNYEPRDDSCSCSLSENDKKLECVCSLKLSDCSVSDEAPCNTSLKDKNDLLLDSGYLDGHGHEKSLPPLEIKLKETVSPTSSCASPEINTFVLIEGTSNLINLDASDQHNTGSSVLTSQKLDNREDHSHTNEPSTVQVTKEKENKEQNKQLIFELDKHSLSESVKVPIYDPVQNLIQEPIQKSIKEEPTEKVLKESYREPVKGPAKEPIKGPVDLIRESDKDTDRVIIKEAIKEPIREHIKKQFKEEFQESVEHQVKEEVKGLLKEFTEVPIKVSPKDSVEEFLKESEKESVEGALKELVKQPIKEPIKELNKELKEQSTEFVKEPSKELVKEPSKDLIKDPSKDLIKESSQELLKEPNQQLIKEPSKELIKEPSQELIKEPSKELIKEEIKDFISCQTKEPVKETAKESIKESDKKQLTKEQVEELHENQIEKSVSDLIKDREQNKRDQVKEHITEQNKEQHKDYCKDKFKDQSKRHKEQHSEEKKEQNTEQHSKSPDSFIAVYDSSPVSVLVSLGDSFGDQSTSSCSELVKGSVELELEKTSPGEILSGYVSENFSFVAAEASRIAEDIFNALEDLDGDDTINKELKMSSLADIDSDVLESGYPKLQCDQTSNSLPQNYYLDGGTKENSNSQNSLRMRKVQEDDLLETSCKTRTDVEVSPEIASRVKDADSGTSGEENVDGKSTHDVRKELLYKKFDNLVDISHPPVTSSLEEDDLPPTDSSVDDNENSRASVQKDEQRSTSLRNQALEYLDKLISLTPSPNPRNKSTAPVDISLNDGQNLQKDSLIQEICLLLDNLCYTENFIVRKSNCVLESSNNPVNPNSAIKWSDTTNIDVQKMPERLKQLRDVVLQQEALHKEEIKKYQKKMKSFEEREHHLSRRMMENSQGQQQMSLILEEYEKTISRLVAEKEHERQSYDLEKGNLMKEKDAISGHLSNIEIAFSDVHQKYEKSKQVIQGFKNNEEALRATVSDYETALKKQEQKYEILKSHAMGQLESANQELIAMRRTHEAENSKLKAMLKKAEIKIHSLEETLQQKIKENQELVNICDELIGKVGSSE